MLMGENALQRQLRKSEHTFPLEMVGLKASAASKWWLALPAPSQALAQRRSSFSTFNKMKCEMITLNRERKKKQSMQMRREQHCSA